MLADWDDYRVNSLSHSYLVFRNKNIVQIATNKRPNVAHLNT